MLNDSSKPAVGLVWGADSSAFNSTEVQTKFGLWLWGWYLSCSVSNTLGTFCWPQHSFLTLDVSLGCPSSSHCGTSALGSLRWSQSVAVPSPVFSWPLPKMAFGRAASPGDMSVCWTGAISLCREQHPLVASGGGLGSQWSFHGKIIHLSDCLSSPC